MCCRLILDVHPDVDVLALWLKIAGYERSPEYPAFWSRALTAERTSVQIKLTNDLVLSLWPSVTTYLGHAEKRLAASLMLQTAALIAEKLSCRVTQLANVVGCIDGTIAQHIIADYPAMPLLFTNVCPGFREVLLGEWRESA